MIVQSLLPIFFLSVPCALLAQLSQPIPLWPAGAPGGTVQTETKEHNTTTEKDNLVGGRPVIRLGDVTNPTLTLYQPPQAKRNGSAVVVFPGGGYRILAIDLEGTEVCDWLNSAGITCALVKYRVPSVAGVPRYAGPLQDAQRAVGLVRSHAAEWGIDPKHVGVLGFSAGGHLCAVLSTNYDKRTYPAVDKADELSCRPDFTVLIYPAYLTLNDKGKQLATELPVSAHTPPTFIVQTEDDPVHVENSLVYYQALKDAQVPAELHIFSTGKHGYGLRHTSEAVTGWPDLAERWLHSH